jgi:hypothetical protein
MRTDPEITRIVRSWLRRDEHESADRVLEAVLAQLDTKPQHRAAWWPAPRLPAMSNFANLAVVAATLVVVVAAVSIGLLLTGRNPSIGQPTPSLAATGSERSPRPEVAEQWVRGAEPRIVVTVAVPDGWTNTGHAVTTGSGSTHAGISFWTISSVYVDPCNWGGSEIVNVPADAGVASSVVSALLTAWAPDAGSASTTAPSVTEPVEAMLDGYAGQYVELTPPSVTDFTTCDGGGYRLWVARDDAARFLQAPGRVLRLWFLDVGTQVLVVDVTYTPVAEQSPDRWPTVLEQLEDLIASVEIRSAGQ